ncbi:MAG TPA: hypothetical protein VF778_11605 [Xanthobacteraceae bacterium]
MFAALIPILLASATMLPAAPTARDQIWLAVSDIHLNIFDRSPQPRFYGHDANLALFESALAEMKRTVPNPPVVLLPGDFLMHRFAFNVGRNRAGTPDEAGIATMAAIASAFGRAFPRAQFVITLGNNDAPCGDYRSADGSAYLAAVARIWEPLVNRGGTAPTFLESFVRTGSYTAALRMRKLRMVVLNTIPFSSEYAGNCGGDRSQAVSDELLWLQTTLRTTPPGSRNIAIMHIPPGVDVAATEYAHGFLAWPFLKAAYNSSLVTILSSASNHVVFAVAGHAHRFDFRLAGDVPIVVLGSISPIYYNNPAFYTMRISPGGSLKDVDVVSFDELTQEWLAARSFDHTWGINRIDAAALASLHARLAADPAVRDRWQAQAYGWPSQRVWRPTWGRRWRIPWCAQTVLTSGFDECAGIERRVQALRILLVAAAFVAIAVALLAVARLFRRRRREA